MNTFLKVLGVIALIWIIFAIAGWLIGFLAKAILWTIIIAGIVFVVAWAAAKGKQVGSRR